MLSLMSATAAWRAASSRAAVLSLFISTGGWAPNPRSMWAVSATWRTCWRTSGFLIRVISSTSKKGSAASFSMLCRALSSPAMASGYIMKWTRPTCM